MLSDIQIGDICRTNLSQPGGLVLVLDIQPYSNAIPRLAAYVEHVEDHPYGYTKGMKGWYLLEELVLVQRDGGQEQS